MCFPPTMSTPQGQHLGELVCRCSQLSELHCDLFLPAAAGGAAALLISLMYATRDVKAVAPQVGVCKHTRAVVHHKTELVACRALLTMGPAGSGSHPAACDEFQ